MLAHLTSEIQEGEVFHPVIVVHHLGSIRILAFKVEELGHLCLDALLVVTQRLVVQQVTLLALAAGVANHARSTTHEDDGLMSATLQVTQHHDAAQVSDVQ